MRSSSGSSNQTFVLALLSVSMLCWCSDAARAGGQGGDARGQVLQLFSASPAEFIENAGQIHDSSVRFAFYGSGANVFHTNAGPVFQVFQSSSPSAIGPQPSASCMFAATFPGARQISPVGAAPAPTQVNFLIGTQTEWLTHLRTYREVVYPGLYDGIDLRTFGRRSSLKYEFRVAPGADYRQIVVRYQGVSSLRVDAAGALHVATPLGELIDDAPYAYQLVDGRETRVPARFRLVDQSAYAFELTDTFDPARELVIDPDLAWCSFIGGKNNDSPFDIATDSAGNAYITGRTGSADLPMPGGFDTTWSKGWDAFVAKFSRTGQLLWATYLGGNGTDYGYGLWADSNCNVFITGYTSSPDFPTLGGFCTTYNGGTADAFITKLTPTGQLAWSSFLGGDKYDEGMGIATDAAGNVFVSGTTSSTNFPAAGGYSTTAIGNYDACIVKVSGDGQLLWTRVFGGKSNDYARALAVYQNGNVICAGRTQSTDFPMLNAFDSSYNGGDDAFVARFSASGELAWSTFLGGSGLDSANGAALDASGNVLIAGQTKSANFPSTGGFDKTLGGTQDACLSKISATGQLLWSTYVGGSMSDSAGGVAVDATGSAFVFGSTSSSDFPTPGGIYTAKNGSADDVFIAKISTACQLQWGTYLGGTYTETGQDVTVDPFGSVLVAGETFSANFPGGLPPRAASGNSDAFVAEITFGHFLTVQSTPCAGAAISGDRPGTTEYFAFFGEANAASIQAAPAFTASGVTYEFVQWLLDGTEQPRGKADLTVTMNTNHLAVAAYSLPVPTLTVKSAPIAGVSITGDKPGNAEYAAACGPRETVRLTATPIADADGTAYHFKKWIVDGIEQPLGQADLTLLMDVNRTAVAEYSSAPLTIAVSSTPIVGVSVTGSRPCTTNTIIPCVYREVVELIAPLEREIDGMCYIFIGWTIDGTDLPTGGNSIALTVYDTHQAVARYVDTPVLIFEGPNERREGPVPPNGTFKVNIYVASIPSFAGLQTRVKFFDSSGTPATFPFGTRVDEYGTLRPLIELNEEAWPDADQYGGSIFGFVNVDLHQSVIGKVRAYTVTYKVPAGALGNYRITASPDDSVIATAEGDPVEYRGVDGSVTIAVLPKRTLTVQSAPMPSLEIQGDHPGTTPYQVTCDSGDTAAFTAPGTATYFGSQCTFQHWTIDGIAQPDGQTSLQVVADADHAVVAVYSATFTLTVKSYPMSGVAITGTQPGQTPYATAADYPGQIELTAPASVVSLGAPCAFVCWTVDGTIWTQGQTTIRLTPDRDHEVVAIYEDPVIAINVQSSPFSQVVIHDSLGDSYTPYTAKRSAGHTVTFTAPATAPFSGSQYSFLHWSIDGIAQPENQLSIQVLYDVAHTIVAFYTPPQVTLSVSSTPVAADITGDKPGHTPYTAVCSVGQVVNLTAPATSWKSDVEYSFIQWAVNGSNRAIRQLNLQVTMTSDSNVTAKWRLAGDANLDCAVNVLDSLAVRNKMGKSVSLSDNWRCDVNGDGVINSKDMVYVAERFTRKCR